MDNKKLNLILIIGLIIGALLRMALLSWSPPSLNWDEAALGYNAYSLLKTGKDEYGNLLPITLRSFEDYKPALYAYFSTPFIYLFGLNEFSVRILSTISGILSLIAVFCITKKIFNKDVAVASTILMAIQPWSIHFSRVAFESNLANSLLISSIAVGLYANKKLNRLVISIFLAVLSSYAYHANKILFLPVIIVLLIYNKVNLRDDKKLIIQILVTIFILTIPLLFSFLSGEGAARLGGTSIMKIYGQGDSSLLSVTNNSLVLLIKEFLGRYLSYFSPVNLFVRGTPELNQRIIGFSSFHYYEFIFWTMGLFALIKKRKSHIIFILLLLLAPIPSALTWNWFSNVRALFMLTLTSILIGLGFSNAVDYINNYSFTKKVIITGVSIFIITQQLIMLIISTFFIMPYTEKGTWQYGFRETMQFVKTTDNEYNKIVFDTGHAKPYIFVLFYGQKDPIEHHGWYISSGLTTEPLEELGKYEFRKINWPEEEKQNNILYIGSQDSIKDSDLTNTPGAVLLQDIKDYHGNDMARIVTIR